MTPQYAYHFLLVEQDFIDKFEATPDVAKKLGHHILELQGHDRLIYR